MSYLPQKLDALPPGKVALARLRHLAEAGAGELADEERRVVRVDFRKIHVVPKVCVDRTKLNDAANDDCAAQMSSAWWGTWNTLYLRTIGKLDWRAGCIDHKLTDHVSGNLALVLQQQLFQLDHVMEGLPGRQFSTRIHWLPLFEREIETILPQSFNWIALIRASIPIPPCTHYIKTLQRES